MKVVISGYIGKKITGIGRNLSCLLEHLDSENQYILYANYDMKKEFNFTKSNIQVKSYNISKNSSIRNLLWTTFIFPIIVLREKADKALIPNFTFLLFKYRPTVVIIHDLIEFNVPDKFSKVRMLYRTKLADPVTARRADHIITVSQNSKRDLIKFLGVAEDKITVVHNGVDREKFKKMDNERSDRILTERGWPRDFILYAGTIDHPGKNVMGIIKAYERLRNEKKYVGKLVLAGMPGSGFEAIREYIQNSLWGSDILLTGYVTDMELTALYSRCRVFVFLSLYEGFGIPPLEALSCGAKVVVSNSSALPEVIGDMGELVNPLLTDDIADTIYLSMNKEQDVLDCERISNHLDNFDWATLSRKFENVILSI